MLQVQVETRATRARAELKENKARKEDPVQMVLPVIWVIRVLKAQLADKAKLDPPDLRVMMEYPDKRVPKDQQAVPEARVSRVNQELLDLQVQREPRVMMARLA